MMIFPYYLYFQLEIFEPLFGKEDAIISDSLNHASIIDGVRLSKAARYRYNNNDMEDLEAKLIQAQAQRNRIIVTDGVFSMDGDIAKMDEICDLADKYNALVMVDDSHATGFIGKKIVKSLANEGYKVFVLTRDIINHQNTFTKENTSLKEVAIGAGCKKVIECSGEETNTILQKALADNDNSYVIISKIKSGNIPVKPIPDIFDVTPGK